MYIIIFIFFFFLKRIFFFFFLKKKKNLNNIYNDNVKSNVNVLCVTKEANFNK